MERLVLLSTRRLNLDMISWPATMPCCRLLGSEPGSRELTLLIRVREVRKGLTSERREARDDVPQLTRPVLGSKVIQQTNEYFVYLFRKELENLLLFFLSKMEQVRERATYKMLAHDSNHVRLFRGHRCVEVTKRRPERDS